MEKLTVKYAKEHLGEMLIYKSFGYQGQDSLGIIKISEVISEYDNARDINLGGVQQANLWTKNSTEEQLTRFKTRLVCRCSYHLNLIAMEVYHTSEQGDKRREFFAYAENSKDDTTFHIGDIDRDVYVVSLDKYTSEKGEFALNFNSNGFVGKYDNEVQPDPIIIAMCLSKSNADTLLLDLFNLEYHTNFSCWQGATETYPYTTCNEGDGAFKGFNCNDRVYDIIKLD